MKALGRMALLGALMLLAGLEGCRDKRLTTNTQQYRDAHGIYDGRINKIAVGPSVFTLPPEALFDVYTEGEILRDRAGKLTLYFDVNRLREATPSGWASTKYGESVVRVEISSRSSGPLWKHARPSLDKGAPQPLLDLTLIPGVKPPPTKYSDQYLYVGRNPGIALAEDEYFEFACQVAWPAEVAKRNGQCRVAYSADAGILVEHFFQERELKNWKAILEAVSIRISQYESQH